MLSGLPAAALLACCGLLACRGEERSSAPPASAPVAKAATRAPMLRSRIHPDLPEFTFTLIVEQASGADAALQVKKIEIRRGRAAAPTQVIEGVDVSLALNGTIGPLQVLDMNFDGYQDLRIMAFQPAGPNIPYLNWLFDPQQGRFVESRALDQITAPEFDPVKREIRSNWRDGATRYGQDIYVYQRGEPVLVRKETREYQRPGLYTMKVLRRVDGTWKMIEQREVREP